MNKIKIDFQEKLEVNESIDPHLKKEKKNPLNGPKLKHVFFFDI